MACKGQAASEMAQRKPSLKRRTHDHKRAEYTRARWKEQPTGLLQCSRASELQCVTCSQPGSAWPQARRGQSQLRRSVQAHLGQGEQPAR
jgi:hypothetical protein